MDKNLTVHHIRQEITITRIGPPCPICGIRVALRKTCCDKDCQHKYHVLYMRKRKRKTERRCPSRMLKI